MSLQPQQALPISLWLTDSVMVAAGKAAAEQGISLNCFIQLAVGDKTAYAQEMQCSEVALPKSVTR